MTTVLTTHYLDEAERLCDRIAVMHQGTIVAQHYHRCRPQPTGPGRLGHSHHRHSHPRLHPLGGELTRTHPPNLLAGPMRGPGEQVPIPP